MLKVINLYVLDRIFSDIESKISPKSKMLYINCLMHHFKEKSANKIKELAIAGTAVVLVSHDLQMIEKHCSRVIWLDNGKIHKIGGPKEVIEDYR